MSITISADDPRDVKAIQIAAGSRGWLRCRTADGEVAWGIPSQCERKPGLYHVVTPTFCSCEDFKRHGLSHARLGETGFHGPCKHIRALQLRDELAQAQKPQHPKRRNLRPVPTAADYDRIFSKFGGD